MFPGLLHFATLPLVCVVVNTNKTVAQLGITIWKYMLQDGSLCMIATRQATGLCLCVNTQYTFGRNHSLQPHMTHEAAWVRQCTVFYSINKAFTHPKFIILSGCMVGTNYVASKTCTYMHTQQNKRKKSLILFSLTRSKMDTFPSDQFW